MSFVATILNALRDVLTNAFLIMFTMIFILLEVSAIEVKLLAAFKRNKDSFVRQKMYVNNLGRYLGIKTIVSIATGITVTVATSMIGLDFPFYGVCSHFFLITYPQLAQLLQLFLQS